MQSPLVAVFAALMFWFFGPDVTREKADDNYDFIVVGAGTTGSVVASKLSDHYSTKVLLLEAGGSDLAEPRIFIPGFFRSLGGSMVDWNYSTAPQHHTFFNKPERVMPYPRGKVLGGSSSINLMAYIRGSPHDYDSWEDHGAEGWNYKSIERNFKNVEFATGEYMPKSVGRNGKLKLSTTFVPDSHFTRLVKGIATRFGFQIHNYIEQLEGFSFTIRTVYGMIRQNSAVAYLRSVLPNSARQLHILTNAHVTKILINAEMKAYGVEYVKDGRNLTAYADKEVILSAGAFGTPQLLMLSGIGPKEELKKFNISVLFDSPGVGSNLNDHIFVRNSFWTNITLPEVQNPELEYFMYGHGPLVDAEYYFHVTKSRFFNTTKSTSNYKHPFPDIFSLLMHTRSGDGHLIFMAMVTLAHGKSKGTVTLRSADPLDSPIIDPKYYSHGDDIDVLVDGEGLRLMEKYETSESMVANGGRFVPPAICEGLFTQQVPRSDGFYKCLIKYTSTHMYHACGTAKMGRKEDKKSVVDPQLRVYGVRNLRVADASVMPHVTTTNIQAPCYMIGDRAAEIIMAEWGLRVGGK